MYFCTEKDIEDYLFEHPQLVKNWGCYVDKWIAKQYRVPSGIIDLLGVAKTFHKDDDRKFPFVLELKNSPIKSKDLAQVCRYAADIDRIMGIRDYSYEDGTAIKMVLGVGEVCEHVQYEAYALNVSLKSIAYKPDPDISGTWEWTTEYSRQITSNIRKAAFSKLFDVFGGNDSKDFEDYVQKKLQQETGTGAN